MLNRDKIIQLGQFYRHHLLVDVLPFWETRVRDSQFGGYLTCFDRTGKLTSTDKSVWLHGRQCWMFSALYNHVEQQRKWLDLARHGREFMLRHAYAGNGRWYYLLDQQGNVKQGTISIYTDHFVLSALVEYALASGSDQDMPLIKETYDTMERNVYDPDFKDIYHGAWSPRYKRHGIYMISLHVAGLAERVLGRERTRPLIDHCLEQILHVFAKDEHQALFESVARDGSFVDEAEGRVLNPGHALESMWFCIEEGKKRNDRGIIERAIRIADWSYQRGYDKEYGGIVSYLDAKFGAPTQMDWHKATGMSWDDKSFWVHAEALYTLALIAVETSRQDYFERFLDLHAWCQAHFFDPEYGEWYAELYRDGRPKLTDKGTIWKSAFHLPRALMLIALLFEGYAR